MAEAIKKFDNLTISAALFQKMIVGASYFFHREKESINALNVFPIPDGDTGTNMSMTMEAAAAAALSYKGNAIGEMAAQAASSALLGARGNSGVILSQMLRGIARGLKGKTEVCPDGFSKAFQYGVVYAYKAVSKPVEGTILTVARETARSIRLAVRSGGGVYEAITTAINKGKEALARTTEMLPVLKEAGVVDAGGLGLVVFLEGCLFAMQNALSEIIAHKNAAGAGDEKHSLTSGLVKTEEAFETDNPYCTELIIKNRTDSAGLKENLASLGDSLIVVSQDNINKVHIHTANPGRVLLTCQAYGSLHDIKIDNMADQHQHAFGLQAQAEAEPVVTLTAKTQQKGKDDIGIIAVSFGEGLKEIFLGLGADEIVYGGQTMNPRVEDLLSAAEKLPTRQVLILPNNKNILLVAGQVQKLSSKEVVVVGSRNMAQGLSALVAFNPAADFTTNISLMEKSLNEVKAAEVTYATRDTVLKGEKVTQGSYLGLFNDNIICAGKNLIPTALDLVAQITGENDELLTVLYGKDCPFEEVSAFAAALKKEYPHLDLELKYGGQPIYYFILAIE